MKSTSCVFRHLLMYFFPFMCLYLRFLHSTLQQKSVKYAHKKFFPHKKCKHKYTQANRIHIAVLRQTIHYTFRISYTRTNAARQHMPPHIRLQTLIAEYITFKVKQAIQRIAHRTITSTFREFWIITRLLNTKRWKPPFEIKTAQNHSTKQKSSCEEHLDATYTRRCISVRLHSKISCAKINMADSAIHKVCPLLPKTSCQTAVPIMLSGEYPCYMSILKVSQSNIIRLRWHLPWVCYATFFKGIWLKCHLSRRSTRTDLRDPRRPLKHKRRILARSFWMPYLQK